MAPATRGRVGFIWIRPPSGMGAECARRAAALEPTLLGMMSGMRGNILTYMKTNHPWTNRTRAAEEGLDSNVGITGRGTVTVSAFHTVPYGGYLETGTSRMAPYPIIRPALEAHYGEARKIMDTIAG